MLLLTACKQLLYIEIIDPATHYLKYFEMALDSPNMTTIQKVSINKINETKVTMTKDDVLPAYFEQYRLPMEATE